MKDFRERRRPKLFPDSTIIALHWDYKDQQKTVFLELLSSILWPSHKNLHCWTIANCFHSVDWQCWPLMEQFPWLPYLLSHLPVLYNCCWIRSNTNRAFFNGLNKPHTNMLTAWCWSVHPQVGPRTTDLFYQRCCSFSWLPTNVDYVMVMPL